MSPVRAASGHEPLEKAVRVEKMKGKYGTIVARDYEHVNLEGWIMKTTRGLLLVVVLCGMLVVPACVTPELPVATGDIDLRILYAGHPGSRREADFVKFLGIHFRDVQTGDLATFSEPAATGFDVVILDYDGDGFEAPRPSLSNDYARATVTVSVAGGLLSSNRGLKTGYL